MKISKKLPQFENYPTLFIVSGEYEAEFYVALNGTIEQKSIIKLPPREEAKEKQAFVGKKAGMLDLQAVSHRERYVEDLKHKFYKNIRDIAYDIIYNNNIKDICIFAPRYVINNIISNLNTRAQNKLHIKIHGEYIKENPLKIVAIFNNEINKVRSYKHYTDMEKNILKIPKIRH